VDDDCKLREEEIEAIAEEDEICVVSNIARSGTPRIIPVSKCACTYYREGNTATHLRQWQRIKFVRYAYQWIIPAAAFTISLASFIEQLL